MDTRSQWAAFANGDLAARNVLLAEHLNLVHHVGRQLGRSLSNELDHDELVSAGTLGLMSAMSSFDPDRGLAFSTFAVPRIRGAILDELRHQDHVPRSVRRKVRDIAAARSVLARTMCRRPKDSEVADVLGVDVKTLWKWESDVEGAIRVPIDRPGNDGGGHHASPLDLMDFDSENGVDERLDREREVTMLREAIMKLKAQERTVLGLYYFEELKLREIAKVVGLTESRVSQIRSRALARLRETVGVALAS